MKPRSARSALQLFLSTVWLGVGVRSQLVLEHLNSGETQHRSQTFLPESDIVIPSVSDTLKTAFNEEFYHSNGTTRSEIDENTYKQLPSTFERKLRIIRYGPGELTPCRWNFIASSPNTGQQDPADAAGGFAGVAMRHPQCNSDSISYYCYQLGAIITYSMSLPNLPRDYYLTAMYQPITMGDAVGAFIRAEDYESPDAIYALQEVVDKRVDKKLQEIRTSIGQRGQQAFQLSDIAAHLMEMPDLYNTQVVLMEPCSVFIVVESSTISFRDRNQNQEREEFRHHTVSKSALLVDFWSQRVAVSWSFGVKKHLRVIIDFRPTPSELPDAYGWYKDVRSGSG